MIPTVEALEPSPNRPVCRVRIHWPKNPTPWLNYGERRIAKTAKRGLHKQQCARQAMWRVDGIPMCAAHAGRRALHALSAVTK